jgi:hypothetical protein
MTPLVTLAKVKISIPPEAVLPLGIGVVALLVLLFAGASLPDGTARKPQAAAKLGLVLALGLSAFVIYKFVLLMPNKYIDLGPPDQPPISLADGPILGFTAAMATVFWRFANQRWIALGFGGLIGLALIAKPFVMPFVTWFDVGSERARVLSDPDTLSILGPGIVVLITALVAGRRST